MAPEPDGKDRRRRRAEMTTQTTLKPVADLTPADLISAYNGRIGCACGCRGTHSYMDAASGTAKRGYPVGPDEVSPRRVANTLRTIQSAPADQIDDSRAAGFGRYGYVAFQSATRHYIVYLR